MTFDTRSGLIQMLAHVRFDSNASTGTASFSKSPTKRALSTARPMLLLILRAFPCPPYSASCAVRSDASANARSGVIQRQLQAFRQSYSHTQITGQKNNSEHVAMLLLSLSVLHPFAFPHRGHLLGEFFQCMAVNGAYSCSSCSL